MAIFIKEQKVLNVNLQTTVNTLVTSVNNHDIALKNMEVQLGQIAAAVNALQKGKFPSDTEVNPREQCKVIKLQSGKQLESRLDEEKKKEERMSKDEDGGAEAEKTSAERSLNPPSSVKFNFDLTNHFAGTQEKKFDEKEKMIEEEEEIPCN